MPPKRGKKGKRRGDESSDEDHNTQAPGVPTVKDEDVGHSAATKGKGKGAGAGGEGGESRKAPQKAKKKRGKGHEDSDDDDGEALDPLAHLRGNGGRKGMAVGDDSEDDRPKKPLTKKEKRRLEEQRQREKAEQERNEEEEDDEVGEGDEEEDYHAAPPVPPKEAKGKGKGGGAGGEGSEPSKAPQKNKKKRGKGHEDSDDDDGKALDPLAHLRGAGGRKGMAMGDDSEDERPRKPLTKKEKRRLEEQRQREKAEQERKEEDGGDDGDVGEEEEDDHDGIAAASAPEVPPPPPKAADAGVGGARKGGKKLKKKHGKGRDDSADDGDEVIDPLAHLRGAGGRKGAAMGDDSEEEQPKKPLTKKEKRRLEEQRLREKKAEQDRGEVDEGLEGRGEDKGEDEEAEALRVRVRIAPASVTDVEMEDASSAAAAAAAAVRKARKGKDKKEKKGKGKKEHAQAVDSGGEDGECTGDGLVEAMESLNLDVDGAGEGGEKVPGESAGKERMSKKERKKAEAAAAATAAAAAVEKEQDEKQEQEQLSVRSKKSKGGGEDSEGGGSGEEEGGGKRRMSKKERKKTKQGGRKKGGQEESPEPVPEVELQPNTTPMDEVEEEVEPTAAGRSELSTAGKEGAAPDAAPAIVDTKECSETVPKTRNAMPTPTAVEEAPVAVVAVEAGGGVGDAEKATEEEDKDKKPKKVKKSKLQRKLEEAARLKAEADAVAGVKAGGDGEGNDKRGEEERAAAAAAAEEEERRRKEEKAARKAKKAAEKEKMRSLLEDLDDDRYYGSDHEEKSAMGKGGKAAAKETIEDEVQRLVAEAEKTSGKGITSRQRKKITQEAEARRRMAEEEQIEEIAHREGAQFGCSQTAVPAGDQQWLNSLDVTIEAFSISAHDKTLFKDASLQVVHGRKYGLVGPNGAGKSTLLKMIAAGELKIPPRIDCLYVEQEVVADDTPAVIAVMKADKIRWRLMEEERKVNRLLREDPENEELNERLQKVHEELHIMGGDGAEARARRILFGLGFDDAMQVKATKNFSGGWRMRISLARALFMEPTLLMLDEPTNHLDLNAVIWLDDYLQKWKKTLLVVSHDQDFLNSVCEEILHLDAKKIVQYKGNYDQFKDMERQKKKQQVKEWEKQQKRLAALKKGGQSKGKAEETVKKSKFREPGGSKKKKNDAVAAGQADVQVAQLAERPKDYTVTLHFPQVSTLNPPIIEVHDVDFRYDTGPMILEDVNFGLDQSSRICVVGPNGAGKTTLLKLLTGALEPTTGLLRRNPRMRTGIYNQHFVDRLPMDIDPTSYLRERFPENTDYQTARNLLGRFGLEGHAHTIKMRDLSGGQKARVVFCELSLQAPHVLFLDEPTNNLDIESIDALCDALREYNGGVVVVTHDARLIEATECRLWIVDEQAVTPWEGEFDEYREHLLAKMEQKIVEQEAARAAKTSRT